MTQSHKRQQSGFTMIELLIAMTVFSVVVIVITVSVIQFSKQYYKGIISTATQNAARTITDDIARSIQFNSGGVTGIPNGPPSGYKGYCVGDSKMYSFELYQQVTDSGTGPNHQGYHGLVSSTVSGCNTNSLPLTVKTLGTLNPAKNQRELLAQHMRLAKFSITSSGGLEIIDVKVVYGDDDLLTNPVGLNPNNLDSPDINCKSTAGSQFCAVAELTTAVQKRVK